MSAPASEVQTSHTPILDRIVPLPEMESTAGRTGMTLAVWFGLVIVAAIVVMFWHPPFVRSGARWILGVTGAMAPLHWTGATVLLYVFFLLAPTFTAVGIHELSHALVGVLVGFRFNSLRVGRLQFDRPFRITLYRGRGTGSGGWASLFPVKQDKLILRAIAMLLAGPLSNLASICVLALLPHSKGMFSALFIYISAILGLMNLVPFRGRAVISDGGRILMLLQNRARGERWLAMLKLLQEMRAGVPAEKMTPEFIARATAVEDKSPDTVVAFALAYATAFWQRKDDEAAQALETCLRHSGLAAPSQRQGLMSDAAIFQAHRRKRIDLAEQWLADIPQKTEFPWLRPRGEVAILGAKGDIAGALKKLDEVEKLILAVPNEAMREISLRAVKRWRAELQS